VNADKCDKCGYAGGPVVLPGSADASCPECGADWPEARLTLTQFIERYKVRAIIRRADANPNDMPRGSTHYRVTFHYDGRRMTVPFSQGPAITTPPTAADVLSCLASDASGYANASADYEEWCREYGYDSDSRKAERTFKAVERQTRALERVFGPEVSEVLIWHTEPL
jgi:hypothetical protein